MNRIRALFALIQAPDSPPPWSLTTVAFTVLFAFVAMLIGAAVALVWASGQDYVQLAGWTLGGLLIIAFVWQTRRADREALRIIQTSTPLLFVMFASFGCALALDLVAILVSGEFLPAPELLGLNPNALGIAQWGFAIAFMAVVQPIAEGLVFRAITLPSLRSLLGTWGSILAAAALAGVFHMLVYPPNYNTASPLTPIVYGLLVPIVEAILLGMVRYASKSSRAAIAAQVAFGLFAVVKLLVLVGRA